MRDIRSLSIDLSKFYPDRCIEILTKNAIPDIDEKHAVIHHSNESILAEYFAYEFAQGRYKKLAALDIRRPFGNCYLPLKYRAGEGVTDLDYKRFFDSARIKAEKYNNFIGTFVIDITDHLVNPYHPAMDRLLDFVDATSTDTKYLFIIDTNDSLIAEKMFKRIVSRVRRLDMIELHVSTSQYADYASMLLQSKGIILTKSINQPLTKYITKISEKTSFSGFESIRDSVDDIIYAIHGMTDAKSVTGKQLVKILDSLVIIDDEKTTMQIGFGRG